MIRTSSTKLNVFHVHALLICVVNQITINFSFIVCAIFTSLYSLVMIVIIFFDSAFFSIAIVQCSSITIIRTTALTYSSLSLSSILL